MQADDAPGLRALLVGVPDQALARLDAFYRLLVVAAAPLDDSGYLRAMPSCRSTSSVLACRCDNA